MRPQEKSKAGRKLRALEVTGELEDRVLAAPKHGKRRPGSQVKLLDALLYDFTGQNPLGLLSSQKKGK